MYTQYVQINMCFRCKHYVYIVFFSYNLQIDTSDTNDGTINQYSNVNDYTEPNFQATINYEYIDVYIYGGDVIKYADLNQIQK